MKFLFVMYYPGYLRNHESVVRALAEKGHDLVLGFNARPKDPTDTLAQQLEQEYPNITTTYVPNRDGRWFVAASFIRRCIDYLRYLDPAYADTPALRARIAGRVPGFIRSLFRTLRLEHSATRRARAHRALIALENAIPTDPAIDRFIADAAPDALIVTPLVDFDSRQLDWVKSAKAVGLPTALAVYSWDNLTNKGHMRLLPDRVLVWNEAQRDEAIRFHGMPRDHVVVTGSQAYDKWFDRAPDMTREDFLAGAGLDASRPYLLYLCSSPFIGGRAEPEFVLELVRKIRDSSDPRLHDVGIMIRPHPQNAKVWEGVDLGNLPNVSLFPEGGANPVDAARRADFYNSLYFSHAVIGINTSAMIEAGIVGRRVLTIRDPRFTDTQEGTLHFHHLVREGLVEIADGVDAGIAPLSQMLAEEARSDSARQFLLSFVRPYGLTNAATPSCVEALEGLKDLSPEATPHRPLMQAAFFPLLLALDFAGRAKVKRAKSPEKSGGKKGETRKATRGRALVRFAGRTLRALGIENFIKQHVLPHVIMASLGQTGSSVSGALEKNIEDELSRIASGTGPIFVGPWTSEVGFELVYWIPFVRHFVEHYNVDPKRLTIVSRGGVRGWYGGLAAGGYHDAFDSISPEDFKAANDRNWSQRGLQKQVMTSELDEILIAAAKKASAGASQDIHVLHPSMMYRLFSPFWTGDSGLNLIARHTAPYPHGIDGGTPETATLPDDFIAVRIYFRPSFPDTPENRELAAAIIAALAAVKPVVVLEPEMTVDDHSVCPVPSAPGIQRIAISDTRTNLDAQTRIMAQASLAICTYGGLAYLGPLLGVPTIGLCSDPAQIKAEHMLAAQAMTQDQTDLAIITPQTLLQMLQGGTIGNTAPDAPELLETPAG